MNAPLSIPSLTPEWLRERLSRVPSCSDARVAALLPFDPPSESFLAFEAVYAGPTRAPRRFLLKINAKGDGYGGREAFLYRDLAPQLDGAPLPPCFDVDHDPETDCALLLLEDLSPTHDLAGAHGPPAPALADLHALSWDRPFIAHPLFTSPIGDIVGLAQACDPGALPAACARIGERALPAFFDGSGADLPAEWRRRIERILAAWPRLYARRIDRGALTLIHGDPHPWNIFTPPGDPCSAGARPRIFDWELLCRGPGAYDLTYYVIRCGLPPDRRRGLHEDLIARYCRRLAERGVEGYDESACREDTRLSLLAAVLPPLLWRRPRNLDTVMAVFEQWDCEDLLSL